MSLKQVYNTIFLFIAIILCFIVGIISISGFYTGFHNLDLCHNEMWISNNINVTLYEMGLDYDVTTLDKCYVDGLKAMHYNFYLFGYFGLIFGLILAIIIIISLKAKNRKDEDIKEI